MPRLKIVCWLFAILSLVALPTRAGGPLIVNGAGQPLVWDLTAGPAPFNPDLGTLGTLDNATAVGLVTANFGVWDAVPSAAISFTNAASLPEDVTPDNIFNFLGVCDGLSPIIFDTDGGITAAVFGGGAENFILGFAGPECGSFVPPVITEGLAVLNGRFIDGIDDPSNPEIPVSDFAAVFIHEFGHYSMLDHTQVNLPQAFDGDPSNDAAVPTMFPFLVNGTEQSTLHRDDIASVSTLYPEPTFFASSGSITGSILLLGTPFQGANVIARNVNDPLQDAVSNVSGARFFPFNEGGPPPAELRGLYEINGLTPGADYTVEIESIDPAFTGGSRVGPLDPPRLLPGPPEFWNGQDESNTNPPDDPTAFAPVPVAAGTPVTGIDITINFQTTDPNEPNNDRGSATPTSCGATIAAELQPPSDVDFYKFAAPTGTRLRAEVFADRIGSPADTLLGVFDRTGNLLAFKDDTGFSGLDPILGVALPPSEGDIYFVGVSGSPDASFTGAHSQAGPYELTLTCEPPPPAVPVGTSPAGVLYVGEGGLSSLRAFADLGNDGVADAETFYSGALPSPTELAFDLNGRLFETALLDQAQMLSGTVSILSDADHNFVSDERLSFSSGLGGVDGLALRQEINPVVFVSDAFGGGTILTFRDVDGDGIPDPATTFASGLDSGISLALDKNGNLFVIDLFAGIRVCRDADNNLVADADPCPVFSSFIAGVALALDPSGNLFVADVNTDSILSLRDSNGDGVADTFTVFADLEQIYFFPFSPLNGITFDSAGNLYALVLDLTTCGFFNPCTSSVLRFADANHDGIADGPPTVFVSGLVDAAGLAFVTDTTPPTLSFTSPADQTIVAVSPTTVTLQLEDIAGTRTNLQVGGVPVFGSPFLLGPGGGVLEASVPLAMGANTLTAVATDASGNIAEASLTLTLDPEAVKNSSVVLGPASLPSSATAGTMNVTLIQFRIQAVADDLNVTSVGTSITGTVRLETLGAVKLWSDVNENGRADAGDTTLASASIGTNGRVTFQGSPLTLIPANQARTFLITVDVPASVRFTGASLLVNPPGLRIPNSLSLWMVWLPAVLAAACLVVRRAWRLSPRLVPACRIALASAAVGAVLILGSCGGGEGSFFEPRSGSLTASISPGAVTAVGASSNLNVTGPSSTLTGPTVILSK